jgi:uncharacterized membrane protein YedE/YeeE
MNTKQCLTVFISGLLFGLGLGFSQMIDRDRVIGFLDLAGVWDPTLLFVLGGAVTVTLISFRFVLKLPHPLLSRLALKIVVGARELLTGNREQEESFGRFYFSSHTFKFFSSPT